MPMAAASRRSYWSTGPNHPCCRSIYATFDFLIYQPEDMASLRSQLTHEVMQLARRAMVAA